MPTDDVSNLPRGMLQHVLRCDIALAPVGLAQLQILDFFGCA